MDLKEIASISGKPGLFKVLKPTRNGVIVETLDEKKIRTVAGVTSRVSILKEVSIYTTNEEGSIPLKEVLKKMYELYKENISVHSKSTEQELFEFLLTVVPDYDRTKVYPSDVKKLINWYQIIWKFAPDTFETLDKEEEDANAKESDEKSKEKSQKTATAKNKKEKVTTEETTSKAKKEEVTAEEKPKKTTASKAKKEEVTTEEKPKKTTASKTKKEEVTTEEKPKKTTASKAKKEEVTTEEKPKKTTASKSKKEEPAKEETPKKKK